MKKIIFGEWPNHKKNSNVSIISRRNNNSWYLGTDGAYYALCKTEFFKVEPLEWDIIDCDKQSMLLMTNKIIFNMSFDMTISNYETSEIRKWLNNVFYNSAFKEEEQNRIILSVLDNSPRTTESLKNQFCCHDTVDAVFLLSYEEAYKKYGLTDIQRMKKPNDYAKSNGAYIAPENGCGFYWLRSPKDDYDFHALTVGYAGQLNYGTVLKTPGGVVPVVRITKQIENLK